MNTNTTPLRTPGGVVEDLAVLDKRATALMSKGRLLAVAGGLVAVACAAAAYLWAGVVEPSTLLKSVHVPAELLQMFAAGNGGTSADNLDWATSLLTSGTGIGLALLAIGILCSAAAGLAGRTRVAICMSVVLLAVGVPTVAAMTALSASAGSAGNQQSDRVVFERNAGVGNLLALVNSMEKADAPPHLRHYVLAQVVLVRAHGLDGGVSANDLNLLRYHVGALHKAMQQGAKPAVEGAAMYALDVVAFDTPRTHAARRYFADASSSAQSWRRVGGLLLALAGLAGAAGAGLAFVGHRIRGRVRSMGLKEVA